MGAEALLARAEHQYGVVARWQARAIGVSRARLARSVQRGELELLTPVVLRVRGAPTSNRQQAMTAALDLGPGSVLSHLSAAVLWGLRGFDLRELHLTRLRSGTRRGSLLGLVHQPMLVLPSHVTVFEGLPVTTPARTVFDLATIVHPMRVERALENAWSERLVDGVVLRQMLAELANRGRPGIQVMRESSAPAVPSTCRRRVHSRGGFATFFDEQAFPRCVAKSMLADRRGWAASTSAIRSYR